jgi:hypothetical protein
MRVLQLVMDTILHLLKKYLHETPILCWRHTLHVEYVLCHKFWGIESVEARILLKVDITFLPIVVIF